MPENKLNNVCRMTIIIHNHLREQLIDELRNIGVKNVLVENARCIRQNISRPIFNLGSFKVALADSPNNIFRLTVEENEGKAILAYLSKKLGLNNPGRGTAYIQDIMEYSQNEPTNAKPLIEEYIDSKPMHNLTLITVVLSMLGKSDRLAEISLRLGAGVPVVFHSRGAGARERMGLLRITVPAEKEVLQLLVPAHDSEVLRRLLIEEAHIDRPGGGFLFQSPVRMGIVDPLISIGRQEQAASIDQIIAAIDELKNSTTWRKRFTSPDPTLVTKNKTNKPIRELVFICDEGHAETLVSAAVSAGAEGATVSSLRSLQLSQEIGSVNTLVERGIICIAQEHQSEVLSVLNCVAQACETSTWILQSSEISTTFVHKPR